jgi:hypothetical protein
MHVLSPMNLLLRPLDARPLAVLLHLSGKRKSASPKGQRWKTGQSVNQANLRFRNSVAQTPESG